MNSDVNLIVIIDKLVDEDNIAIINNQSDGIAANNRDFGPFFDLLKGTITHSITNIDAISSLTFTINSRIEQQFLNEITSDALIQSTSDIVQNGGESNLLTEFNKFIATFEGRPLKVIDRTNEGDIVKFDGFIAMNPGSISATSGTQFTLVCKTLLAQLDQLNSNSSWQDATETYKNIFTAQQGARVNLMDLIDELFDQTLAENSNIEIFDGAAPSLPDMVWAVIIPNKMRLQVLQEIFIPYSRIIFQKENGDITIQPLFIDDKTDEIYSINCFNNFDATWIGFDSVNMAASLPNRVDVLWGTGIPFDPFGGNINNPDIFCSTPKVDKETNQILPSNIDGVLDYTTVYASSVRLYNSGKFTMPVMETLSMDPSMVLNAPLLNSIMELYNTKDFIFSNIYVSGDTKVNGMAMLYSQIYMAQINVRNYNATITYDYLQLQGAESPLGKVVTINNASNIDYKDMLVMSTTLDFSPENGCIYSIDTCPLLSITGVWSSIND